VKVGRTAAITALLASALIAAAALLSASRHDVAAPAASASDGGVVQLSEEDNDEGTEEADGEEDDTMEDADSEDHDEVPEELPELVRGVPKTCEGCKQRHNGPVMKPANSSHFLASHKTGALNVSWFGKTKTKYFKGATTVNHATGMILHEKPFEKLYLMNSPVHTSTKRHDFAYLKLAGNSFRVNVDMGSHAASCGCNVAFFLVSMPGSGGKDGHDHYCDANCVGGICCAEFDLMEMNKHTLQVTSHACHDYKKPPARSSSSSCDHDGHPIEKFGNGGHDFGPGSHYTIDSKKRFEFRMDFPIVDGTLKGHIKISQDGKSVRKTMDNLNSIWGPLADGMALTLDAWHSEDLTWLDGGACSKPEHCNMAATVFDSFVIEKLDTNHPSPDSRRRRDRRRRSHGCPGQNGFDCAWADRVGCNNDDGSEGFCRCCCHRMSSHHCKWHR